MYKLNDQSGFGLVEAILLVFILAGLGVVGWYMHKTEKQLVTDNTTTNTVAVNKKQIKPTATLTTPIFSGTLIGDECVTSNLPIGDVGCYVTVNGNIQVVVMHGNARVQQPWGNLINFPEYPTNPVESKVTVYAQKLDSTHYTLEGSVNYYVKINN